MIRTSPVFLLLMLISHSIWAQECTTISMTGNPEFPPVTWNQKDGTLTGAYVEYASTVMKELGVKPEIEPSGNWARAQLRVKRGEVDLLLAPYYNKHRALWLHFIHPSVSLDPAVVFVKKGNQFRYRQFADLKAKKGVLQRGYSLGVQFDEYAKKNLSIVWVNSWDSAFQMLMMKRVDYLPHSYYAGLLQVKKLGLENDVETLEPPILEDKMYLAISIKSPCVSIIKRLSTVVERLKQTKYMEELMETYIKIYNKGNQRT
ncbi:substrate-binding periplasmic protein [Algicola sagamiensis]|uniref:substrate-binding periplasmic protein n=1 Tax=Algicola sagamiensis TaxID=163869 RepID=UPI000A0618B0|nr:transporter substrate-binding domain-containing protein [Algicola sagamiensis]